jgi:hypothetical protein
MNIYTRKNQPIKVSEKHFEELSKYTWMIDGNGYAVTSVYIMSRKESRETGLCRSKNLRMHRLVYELEHNILLSLTDEIDHINQDKIDNTIENLRVSELGSGINQINVGLRADNTSGYKGVIYREKTGKWEVKISYKNKRIWLGAYKDKNIAAQMYNEKALELFGDACYLNKINITTI